MASALKLHLALAGPLLLAASLLATPGAASAQDREPPSEAMQFFDQARVAYREGRYPDAAADLERALVLDPNAPALLFNLGRVYELMGRYDEAIDVYTRLQTVTPASEAEERARTEQILERLRGAREHAAPPPTIEVVGAIEQGPTFVRERGVADGAFWGVLITGAVVTAGAAALGITALAMHGGLNDRVLGPDYTYDDYQAELSTAQTLGLVADIAGGVGAATILGALVLFGVRERVYEVWPDRDEAQARGGLDVDLVLGLGSAGLVGSF
jgi:tetratricopeptide (TPR) repeat protein